MSGISCLDIGHKKDTTRSQLQPAAEYVSPFDRSQTSFWSATTTFCSIISCIVSFLLEAIFYAPQNKGYHFRGCPGEQKAGRWLWAEKLVFLAHHGAPSTPVFPSVRYIQAKMSYDGTYESSHPPHRDRTLHVKLSNVSFFCVGMLTFPYL